jgi:hypothetical protein
MDGHSTRAIRRAESSTTKRTERQLPRSETRYEKTARRDAAQAVTEGGAIVAQPWEPYEEGTVRLAPLLEGQIRRNRLDEPNKWITTRRRTAA